MAIPGNANLLLLQSAAAAPTGYTIDRSVRFNSADSAYLSRTPSSAGNRQTWTWSGWVKRQDSGSEDVFTADSDSGGGNSGLFFNSSDQLLLNLSDLITGAIKTTQVFRDFSSWYHIVAVADTTNSTSTDRLRLYVNGERVTQLATTSYPSQNESAGFVNSTNVHNLGRRAEDGTQYYNGYLADVHFIDGQALAATDFGEFDADTGVWNPIAYAGSYGTNGFHLKFDNTADLGEDAAGSNDWTVNNISAGASVYFVNQGGTSLDSYIPSGFTNTQDPASLFTDDSNGVLVSAPTGGNWLRMKATSSTATVKWMTYDGGSGGPTITLSVNLDGSGGYITPSVTGSGSSSDPKIGTFSVSAGTSYYIRTNLTGSLNTSMVLYVTNLEGDEGSGQDSLRDSPTNGDTANDTGAGGEVPGNYATWNPLTKGSNSTLSNGNLDIATTDNSGANRATIGVSSGKWYWEVTVNSGADFHVGIATADASLTEYNGFNAYSWAYNAYNGKLYHNASPVNYGATYTAGDTVGVALDADNGNLYFYKNGTIQNSGTAAATGLTSGPYFPSFSDGGSGSAASNSSWNFGQRPFAYTAPTGYQPLTTALLDDPTIADGSTAMDVALYTGNGTSQTITGLGFSPDAVWVKRRDAVQLPRLQDTVRGATSVLYPSGADPQDTSTGDVTAFNSDGFSVGSFLNAASASYVAWTWDGGSSTVSNTDGSITSSVRANASAGFSICTYTGTGSNATFGHGLGVAPAFVTIKNRDESASWISYHSALGNTKFIYLDRTDAAATDAYNLVWQSTTPSSSVVTIGTSTNLNKSGIDYVAYCFAPVEGYSAFGSYTGTSGQNFVHLGFRPKLLIIKNSSNSSFPAYTGWAMFDSSRSTYNVNTNALWANSSQQEGLRGNGGTVTTADFALDMLSNGFCLRDNGASEINLSGNTYIYAAFAENPFKYARAR